MVVPHAHRPTIDELLEHAIQAINRGDRATADALAGRVLAVDHSNSEAEELLAVPADHGEIRRITIMFADLVDSTALSTRIEPETYRTVVGRYRHEVVRIVERYEGHIGHTKGDGLLAVFGHPQPHENDVRRAVQAGVDITRDVARLSERVRRRFGFDINVRVGIHRGLVYLDTAEDDVYGFAANLAARMCSIADPGTVAVSEAVERLVRDRFELRIRSPQPVKGIEGPVVSYQAIAERDRTRIPLGPLVGRQREIAHLEARWQQIQSGTLTTAGVAFRGEPGIGKSRLACAAVEMAERSGAVVLELVGSPFHTDVGLHPVRKLLERTCRIHRTSDHSERLRLLRTKLAAHSLETDATVGLLAPVLGISPDKGYEPVPVQGLKLHEQISAAIHDYLIACTGDGPGLVVVEDMHWFDDSTIEVVRSLLGSEFGRLLVVMTSRELASLPDSSRADVFDLKPLSEQETDELIRALYPAMTASVRTTVRRRCDGVPLYIEEVVAKLKEQQPDAEPVLVPDTLYEALFARLRATEGALGVVEAAATIGSQFDRGLLRSVSEMTDGEVDRVTRDLLGAKVFEAAGKESLRFRHELLREVAAELPPPSLRRRLHSRVADALETIAAKGDPDWPLVALHLERAHRFDEAVSAYQRASSTARRRGALEEARAYLSRALAQLDQLPPGAGRDQREVKLRLRHGFLAAAAEGPGCADAVDDFERSLKLCREPNADELFSVLMAIFAYYVSRADLRRAEHVVRSLKISVDKGREWWRSENIGGSGTLSWLRGEFEEARRQLEEAAALVDCRPKRDVEAEWFMPHDPEVLILTGLAHARWLRGDLAGADQALARCERRIDELDFPQGPFSLCYARYVEVWIYIEAGRFERAAELAAEMSQRAERHGFDQWIGLGTALHCDAAALAKVAAGDEDAETMPNNIAILSAWMDACRFLEAKGYLTAFDGHIARLLIATGRLDEARDRANSGLQLAEETGQHYYDAELLRLRAGTHADPAARHADLQAAAELARRQGATVFVLRAALDDYRVRGEAARRSVAEAVQLFPDDSTWPELTRARVLLV
ncbi:ATP-binding protein [Mycobacterium sp.]|uniref:ATP-binding protein n=1 Tax=Mycobacterium sp. TaxID=1785 RepID=UPI002D42DA84|nr:adenylate/guanylate cyclase domain-containing protein [Mycobacterium sp.]HZA08694.1 adenylate/guanylate cyclase domain-containing protein [Mycobacterium sp.]